MNSILIFSILFTAQSPQKWSTNGWAGMDSNPDKVTAQSLPTPITSSPFPKQDKMKSLLAPAIKLIETPKSAPVEERVPTAEPGPKMSRIEPEPVAVAAANRGTKIPDGKYVKPIQPAIRQYSENAQWYNVSQGWVYGIKDGNKITIANDDDFVPLGAEGEKMKSWFLVGENEWTWGVMRNGKVMRKTEDVVNSATRPTGSPVRQSAQPRPMTFTIQPPVTYAPSSIPTNSFGASNCASGNCSQPIQFGAQNMGSYGASSSYNIRQSGGIIRGGIIRGGCTSGRCGM